MGIGLGRQAVRRPAGVPDPDPSLHGLGVEALGEIVELAFGASAFDAPVDEHRNPGRIIAAVFEEARGHPLLGDNADDAAHQTFLRNRARISAARPGLSTCCPRAIERASGATSRVTTLPAAT